MPASSNPLRAPRGVVGVLIGRGRLRYASRLAPRSVEIAAAEGTEFAEGELENRLQRLVEEKAIRGRVVLGFEPELEFFATERKLHFAGRSGGMLGALVAELGQDMIGRELDTSLAPEVFSTALLVPGRYAREARRGLSALGHKNVRMVSTTHALQSAAERNEPRKLRRAGSQIRIFTGEGQGMAQLIQEGDLLARHVFEFSQARDFAVISAARRLLGVARDSLHLAADPEIVLHGEEELLQRVLGELGGVSGRVAHRFLADADWQCAALAACGFSRGSSVSIVQSGGRSLGGEPAPFPVPGLLAAAGTLVAVGFWLNLSAGELDAEIRESDHASVGVFDRFGDDVYELRDHEERLGAAAYLASAFAQDRVRWAPLLLELPRLLPDGVAMEGFEGSYPLYFVADDPATPPPADEFSNNRWCELSATAAARDGDAPPEIQFFTFALRESPVFSASFRRVNGAGVVLHEEDETPWVESRVRCLAR